jgi:glucoamylase
MADRPSIEWLERRRRGAARALRRAVSATDLSFERPGFGRLVRPAPGSILASPRGAHWDPEPDYFHHWTRDAAIALRAIPDAIAAEPDAAGFWRQAASDHIRFSLAISEPSRSALAANPIAASTLPSHRQYLRPDDELRALTGEAWLGEPRFAPDGAPDLERWSGPQDDGPALRATALIGVLETLPELNGPEAETLIARDLSYTASVAGRACFGPWEEAPMRRTTFTLIAQWDALERGALWFERRGRDGAKLHAAATRTEALINEAADSASGGWRESIEAPEGDLDAATILAILHAGRTSGPFAISSPRTRATVSALETTFAKLYPFNRGRSVPGIGRWAGDTFIGGNPWYPVTLGFAELHYRIAEKTDDRQAFGKAERWMALVEDVAPEGDDLPEQFHRETGAPESCRALTWSAAAFLGAEAARQAALQAMA